MMKYEISCLIQYDYRVGTLTYIIHIYNQNNGDLQNSYDQC